MQKKILIRDKLFNVYIRGEAIQERIKELSAKINNDYSGKTPVFIAILNGSFFFAADLLKNIEIDCELSFVKLASYQGVNSSGSVKILIGLMKSIENRDVVIIEDIIDSGKTITRMLKLLEEEKPSSIKVISLLFKREALSFSYEPDYIGFEVENKFLVGYGLDYDELGRNLPDLYLAE